MNDIPFHNAHKRLCLKVDTSVFPVYVSFCKILLIFCGKNLLPFCNDDVIT